jgi:hypothetical protein
MIGNWRPNSSTPAKQEVRDLPVASWPGGVARKRSNKSALRATAGPASATGRGQQLLSTTLRGRRGLATRCALWRHRKQPDQSVDINHSTS